MVRAPCQWTCPLSCCYYYCLCWYWCSTLVVMAAAQGLSVGVWVQACLHMLVGLALLCALWDLPVCSVEPEDREKNGLVGWVWLLPRLGCGSCPGVRCWESLRWTLL